MKNDCGQFIIRIASAQIAMFRFLLEAHDNLALFSVAEKNSGRLRILFARESRDEVQRALLEIAQTVPLHFEDIPGAPEILKPPF